MGGRGRGKRKTNQIVFLGVVVVILALVISSASLDILPGFEGEQNGIYGYQVGANPAVTIGNPLPTRAGACSYAWDSSPSITSASVTVKSYEQGLGGCNALTENFGSDTLTVDAQENPISASNPYTTGQTVNYYVPVPGSSTKYEYVTGQVEVYTYNLDFSVQSGSCGCYNFGGDTVWFNLYSQVWNQATSQQLANGTTVKGQAFETPLYAVVSNVQWSHQSSNELDASVIGHAFTFYSSPSTTGQTLVTLANPTTQNVNQSLGSQYAPDSRFQRLVYYPVSLIYFNNNPNPVTGCDLGCQGPSVTISVTLYTLRIGEYILTNPDKTSLQQRQQNCTGITCVYNALAGLGNWLSSPLGTLFSFLVIGAVILVALVFLGVRIPGFVRGRPRGGFLDMSKGNNVFFRNRVASVRGNNALATIGLLVLLVGMVALVSIESLSTVGGSSSQGTSPNEFLALAAIFAIVFAAFLFGNKRRRR